MMRTTTLKVESIVFYSFNNSRFEGQICVIPSNYYNPGQVDAHKDARLLPFSVPIYVVGDAELPTGRIVVPEYRLFLRVKGTETPTLDAYLASLKAGNLYTPASAAAFQEDGITFQHARVLAKVVSKVNSEYVEGRIERGCLYASGWEETNAGHLQKLVADKFGEDIAARIETESFFTFRRSVRLTENEYDPHFVGSIRRFGGGRSVRFSGAPGMNLDFYDRYREGDERKED